MTPEQLKERFNMYNAVWRYYKKWCEEQHDYTKMISEADAILNSYNNHPFIAGIMLEVMRDLDRQDTKGAISQ